MPKIASSVIPLIITLSHDTPVTSIHRLSFINFSSGEYMIVPRDSDLHVPLLDVDGRVKALVDDSILKRRPSDLNKSPPVLITTSATSHKILRLILPQTVASMHAVLIWTPIRAVSVACVAEQRRLMDRHEHSLQYMLGNESMVEALLLCYQIHMEGVYGHADWIARTLE